MTTPQTRYLWHYALHEQVARERLVYVFAYFQPYKRDRVLEQLKSALAAMSVHSYAFWELIGDYDLLIQAWLPRMANIADLKAKLDESITRPVDADFFPIVIDGFIAHSMWPGQPLDIESAVEAIDASHFVDLNGPTSLPKGALAKYTGGNYIRRLRPSRTLKFFLRVTPPRRPSNAHTEGVIAQRLWEAMSLVPSVTSPTLMRAQGDGVIYLISGRVKPGDFESIAGELVTRVSDLGHFEVLGSRTNTHLSAFFDPLDRREQLLPYSEDAALAGDLTKDGLLQLLEQGEDDSHEFKGSFITDFDAALGRRAAARSGRDTLRDVGKAIVGLLNAWGGRVVVGVVESRFYDVESLAGAGYDNPITVGDYIVVGVEKEFPNWDELLRKVQSQLDTIIHDKPIGMISIKKVEIDNHTVAVIDVLWPSKYFFLEEKVVVSKGQIETREVFYGRRDAETQPYLKHRDLLDYRESHPRNRSNTSRFIQKSD